jgi:hypothetical protein
VIAPRSRLETRDHENGRDLDETYRSRRPDAAMQSGLAAWSTSILSRLSHSRWPARPSRVHRCVRVDRHGHRSVSETHLATRTSTNQRSQSFLRAIERMRRRNHQIKAFKRTIVSPDRLPCRPTVAGFGPYPSPRTTVIAQESSREPPSSRDTRRW